MEPAYLFVTALGINPWKNAFPKSSLPTASLPKSALPFSLLLPAVKLPLKISSCIATHPSYPMVQRSSLRQWSAQHSIMGRWLRQCQQHMPLPASAARAFFGFTFLSSFFFSPVGICNERIAWIEKNEVTPWLWKRGEQAMQLGFCERGHEPREQWWGGLLHNAE